jgi:hypothetical protein
MFHCDGARDTASEPLSASGVSHRKEECDAAHGDCEHSIRPVSSAYGCRATAEGDYKKIFRVSENLRVLDDSADVNSCRTIAVDSQAQEYQIGCRDSENTGTIIVTAPFHITDKAARVTSSKLAAHAQNTATPEQFAQCAKVWGSR